MPDVESSSRALLTAETSSHRQSNRASGPCRPESTRARSRHPDAARPTPGVGEVHADADGGRLAHRFPDVRGTHDAFEQPVFHRDCGCNDRDRRHRRRCLFRRQWIRMQRPERSASTAAEPKLNATSAIHIAERRDCCTDPFCRRFGFHVSNVSVPQGHRNLAVTQQSRHRRERYALHDGIAGETVTQAVETDFLDPGSSSYKIPDGRSA